MKKRVAVIGCSHSDYHQVLYGPSSNGEDWVNQFSQIFDGWEFHNFAVQAHGPLYYDYVLKEICANYPPNYFDTLIVQYTVGGRWFMPVNIPELSSNTNLLVSPEKNRIHNNYYVYTFLPQRLVTTVNAAQLFECAKASTKQKKIAKQLEHSIDEVRARDGLAFRYENNFAKLLNTLYSSYFNNIFCFDFSNKHFNDKFADDDFEYRNNIGHTLPFISWVHNKYGWDYIATDILDDTLHCTKYGNEVLVKEYLMPSKLGEHFKNE